MNDFLYQLQQSELKILKLFHDYCNKHNLKYYLIGGALLGSVRYEGFIPWDDDIDVAMFREDYEKIQTLWETSPVPGYFLQSDKSDPLFARGILKLRKNGTKLIEHSSRNIDMHHGIYIDIFPIDYVDKDKGLFMNLRGAAIKKLMSLRSIKSGYDNGNHKLLKMIIKKYVPISKKNIDKTIGKLCQKESGKKGKYAIIWLHNYHWRNQVHEVEVFGSNDKCVFEGNEFYAPSNKHAFLKKVFGNYLDEPPPEKRITPHNYVQITFKE